MLAIPLSRRTLPMPPTLLGPASTLTRRSLPMLGVRAACGFPSPAEDFFREDDRLDLNEKLIANPAATFLVQADCGGSMVDYGIQDGDLLIGYRLQKDYEQENVVVYKRDGKSYVGRVVAKSGDYVDKT